MPGMPRDVAGRKSLGVSVSAMTGHDCARRHLARLGSSNRGIRFATWTENARISSRRERANVPSARRHSSSQQGDARELCHAAGAHILATRRLAEGANVPFRPLAVRREAARDNREPFR